MPPSQYHTGNPQAPLGVPGTHGADRTAPRRPGYRSGGGGGPDGVLAKDRLASGDSRNVSIHRRTTTSPDSDADSQTRRIRAGVKMVIATALARNVASAA
jgi:hypothetical protein